MWKAFLILFRNLGKWRNKWDEMPDDDKARNAKEGSMRYFPGRFTPWVWGEEQPELPPDNGPTGKITSYKMVAKAMDWLEQEMDVHPLVWARAEHALALSTKSKRETQLEYLQIGMAAILKKNYCSFIHPLAETEKFNDVEYLPPSCLHALHPDKRCKRAAAKMLVYSAIHPAWHPQDLKKVATTALQAGWSEKAAIAGIKPMMELQDIQNMAAWKRGGGTPARLGSVRSQSGRG